MESAKLMPLEGHLAELRRMLIVSLAALAISSTVIYLSGKDIIFQFLATSMHELGLPLIFISVPEAFLTKIKICLFCGFIMALPVILWQILSFIFPAVQVTFRKTIIAVVISSFILFLLGILFAYQVVARCAIFFLLNSAGGLQPMVTIGRYVDFLFSLLLPFGIVFQLPLAVLGLTRLGVSSISTIRTKRKYIYLLIFVIAAILTPPDIVSQILLALPVLVLFEASLGAACIFSKRKKLYRKEEYSENV